MGMLDRLTGLLSRLAALVAGLLLMLMVGHTLLEMTLRAFFGTSTFVLDEFVGYEVAALTMLGLGHALNSGGIIRVNLVTQLAGPRQQRWLELAVVVLTFALCVFLCRYYGLAIETAFLRGTRSNTLAATPQWIPMTVFLVGVLVFMLQLAAYAARIVSGGRLIDTRDEGY